MEKDPNENNLEEFFRNQLKNYEAAENGWNMPPDTIWQEVTPLIRTSMKASRTRSIRKFLPLLGIVFCSFLVYQFVRNTRKIDQLSTEIASMKNELVEYQGKIRELNKQENYLYRQAAQPSAIPTGSPEMTPTDTSGAAFPFSSSSEVGLNRKETPKLLRLEEHASTVNTSSARSNAPPPLRPAVKELDQVHSALLPPLPGLPFSDLQPHETAPEIEPLKTPQRKRVTSARLKLTAGPMRVSRILTNPPNDFENRDKHQFSGTKLGVSLEWPLSYRWYVEAGLDYTRYAAQSVHERYFRYDPSNENIPGLDPYDSQIDRSFHSPFGYVDTKLIFSRDPGSTLSSHRRIDMTVQSSSQIHYLTIPLLVNYRITHSRLGLFLRAGLQGSAQIGQKYTVRNVLFDHSALQFKSGAVTSDFENLQAFHFQYTAGTGIAYWISPQYAIHFESTFSRSLTDVSSIEGVPIRLQSIGIHGGLKLRF